MSANNTQFFESQCMFLCDQITLEILDVNEFFLRRIGLERSEVISRNLYDFVEQANPEYEQAIQQKKYSSTFDNVWRIGCPNGQESFVQFSSQLITFKGKPAKLIIAHDLTSYLTQPEKYVQVLSSPVGFQGFPLAEIEWDAQSRVLRWSDKAEEMFGYSQAEAMNDPDFHDKLVFPGDLDFVHETIKGACELKEHTISITNRNVSKDGRIIHNEWHNSILYDDDGNVVSTYSLVSDITNLIEARHQAERSTASYEDLFNSITDAIYLLDENAEIVSANAGVEKMYGYTRKEVVGKNQSLLRAPGKFSNEVIELLLGKDEISARQIEGWSKKANGEVFPTEMLINKGNYFGQDVLIIVERDISDRKFAEEELRRRQQQLQELFHTSPLGITMLNTHNEIISVNRGFERIFGYSDEEIIGLEIDRLIVPKEKYKEAVELSNLQRVSERELVRKTKDGHLINVLVYFVPVRVDGKIDAKYAIYLDITERKKTEEYIKKSLREKEVLLAEIHHRVKNNLAVITGLLELQSYATDDLNSKQVLKESRMRVHSIALVHEKLYKNENLSAIEMQPYVSELVQTLRNTLNTSETSLNCHVEVENFNLIITQAIPCGLLINEVVTNSYKHAFEEKQEGNIWINFWKDGEYVLLTIKDDGVGIENIGNSKMSPSLGMKLIRTLSKQLRAQTEIHVNDGTTFSFRFKREEQDAKNSGFKMTRF